MDNLLPENLKGKGREISLAMFEKEKTNAINMGRLFEDASSFKEGFSGTSIGSMFSKRNLLLGAAGGAMVAGGYIGYKLNDNKGRFKATDALYASGMGLGLGAAIGLGYKPAKRLTTGIYNGFKNIGASRSSANNELNMTQAELSNLLA